MEIFVQLSNIIHEISQELKNQLLVAAISVSFSVGQDYEKAAVLFASIADSDNKSATGVVAAGYEIGTLYEQGSGVEWDPDKAIGLYREAAQYENEKAIEALARLSE